MNVIGDFHLIRPLWLFAIPVVILVWWFYRRNKDPLAGWREVIAPELLREFVVGEDSLLRNGRGTWLLVGWLVAVISLAGPTWKIEPSPFAEDAAPVLVLLKTGESMDVTEPAPSRMERARLKVVDLTKAETAQPVGLIAYSGSAHLVMPPTKDTGVVATMAQELSPAIMPKPGDDLAAAISLAAETFGETGGIVLVVADTIDKAQYDTFRQLTRANRLVVIVHAIAGSDSVEMDAIRDAARALSASVVPLTPDATDIDSIVSQAAKAGEFVAARGAGNRWTESGYWLVPIVALISLYHFRRESETEEGMEG